MKKADWKPRDVIALVVIIGCFALLLAGRDSYVSWALLGVVGGYYGIQVTPYIKLGLRQPQKPPEP